MDLIQYSMYIFLLIDISIHVYKKKSMSFIIRYAVVYLLFKPIEIVDIGFVNSLIFKLVSIGTVLYSLSYSFVGVLMFFSSNYNRDFWRSVYFIVYIVFTIIIYLIVIALSRSGVIPIVLSWI